MTAPTKASRKEELALFKAELAKLTARYREQGRVLPALADLAESEGRRADEAMKIVEAVRELLAAKVAMLSAISADFMSDARLTYLRKLSIVEHLELPPKEQP